MPVYIYDQRFPVWLQCTHVGSTLTCWLQRCGAIKLYVDSDLFVFTMSSSFFIKAKQNPKFAKKGKNATALKRKVSYSIASMQLRLKHNAVGLLVYLPNIFWIEDHDILFSYLFIFLIVKLCCRVKEMQLERAKYETRKPAQNTTRRSPVTLRQRG